MMARVSEEEDINDKDSFVVGEGNEIISLL